MCRFCALDIILGPTKYLAKNLICALKMKIKMKMISSWWPVKVPQMKYETYLRNDSEIVLVLYAILSQTQRRAIYLMFNWSIKSYDTYNYKS